MRDPERIDKVLEVVKRVWKDNPDLRLGQLIGNVFKDPTLYYIEDENFVTTLIRYYTHLEEEDYVNSNRT